MEFKNALYVPSLSTHLFSIKEFLRYQGCYFFGENNNVTLTFPTFLTDAHIHDEITFSISPTNTTPIFSTKNAITHNKFTNPHPLSSPPTLHAKRNTNKLYSSDYNELIDKLDFDASILNTSKQSNQKSFVTKTSEPSATPPSNISTPSLPTPTPTVEHVEPFTLSTPTEQQHTFTSNPTPPSPSLPKWIHHDSKVTIKLPQSNSFIKGILLKHTDTKFLLHSGRSRREGPKTPISNTTLLNLYNNGSLLQGHTHLIRSLISHSNHTHTHNPRPLPVEHKPTSSWPDQTSITVDYLRKSFGFRNIDNIIKEIQQAASHNFSISTKEREKIIDIGEVATVPKSSSNKTPLPLPMKFGCVIHMDIIYRTVTAFDNIKYALFLVDCATRHKFILPMQNLKSDLLPTLQQFCKNIGFIPERFITDFDHKLMGRSVLDNFQDTEGNNTIESAPPRKQNQNGLAEGNWKSILYMSRSWLTSHLLPSKFWWWALKRATELSNYLPLRIDNKLTTPHECVYGVKPDFRNILPQFSIAYLNRTRDDNIERKSTHSHSIRAILIGRDPKSAAFQFYHPSTKKTPTSDSFTIDDTLPSGPAFGLNFDGGLYFNRYCDFNDKLRPPQFIPDQTVFVTSFDPPRQGTVLTVPTSNTKPIYSIQLNDNSIHQFTEDLLTDTDPSLSPENINRSTNFFPTWIKNLARATLFLDNMTTAVKGYLINMNNEWFFKATNKGDNTTIMLPDFYINAHNLYESFQLFHGHPRYKTIQKLKAAKQFTTIFAKHVSARGLTTEDLPTLLKHKLLNPNDQRIWNSAYAEECFGLVDLPCWITISHEEYLKTKHLVTSVLPYMTVSTIKYDEFGKPKRAKYRFVALGNLESYK